MKIEKKMSKLLRKENRTKAKLIISRININLKFSKWLKSMKILKLKYKRSGKNSSSYRSNIIIFCKFNKNKKKQKNNSKSKKKLVFHKVK